MLPRRATWLPFAVYVVNVSEKQEEQNEQVQQGNIKKQRRHNEILETKTPKVLNELHLSGVLYGRTSTANTGVARHPSETTHPWEKRLSL